MSDVSFFPLWGLLLQAVDAASLELTFRRVGRIANGLLEALGHAVARAVVIDVEVVLLQHRILAARHFPRGCAESGAGEDADLFLVEGSAVDDNMVDVSLNVVDGVDLPGHVEDAARGVEALPVAVVLPGDVGLAQKAAGCRRRHRGDRGGWREHIGVAMKKMSRGAARSQHKESNGNGEERAHVCFG